MALAHQPTRPIEQLCPLVRPTPSRVKAAPYGHDNSLGHYEDGSLPKVLHLRARVSGYVRDACERYIGDALWEHGLDIHDLGHRIVEEVLDAAARSVHEDDMLPREAVRCEVRKLVRERDDVSRATGYWSGVGGI